MIFALPARGDTDYSMRIFNSDGSEPEMCGNGIRCLVNISANAYPLSYLITQCIKFQHNAWGLRRVRIRVFVLLWSSDLRAVA